MYLPPRPGGGVPSSAHFSGLACSSVDGGWASAWCRHGVISSADVRGRDKRPASRCRWSPRPTLHQSPRRVGSHGAPRSPQVTFTRPVACPGSKASDLLTSRSPFSCMTCSRGYQGKTSALRLRVTPSEPWRHTKGPDLRVCKSSLTVCGGCPRVRCFPCFLFLQILHCSTAALFSSFLTHIAAMKGPKPMTVVLKLGESLWKTLFIFLQILLMSV